MGNNFHTLYGHFSDDGKEYVITDYRTPRPWVNVISNGSYGMVVSQVGGGFSWIEHANLNRLTRWQQDLIRDDWGKYIYIRDDDSGEFWSPTVRPVLAELEAYECRHGLGYTRFSSVRDGIRCNLRYFVPFGNNLEVWTLTLQNLSGRPRRLSVFTYFEWCLGVCPDNHREFHKTFLETEFDNESQVLLARKRLWEAPSDRGHWNMSWDRTAYFACSQQVDGFTGDKADFIGMYRDLSRPVALENETLQGEDGKWNDSVAVMHKRIKLVQDEEKTMHFYLGAEKSTEAVLATVEQFRRKGEVPQAFANVQSEWRRLLQATEVETPDQAVNYMTNTWLVYQAISARLWGRAAYYQQSGAYGFRDQLQDSQIFLYRDPGQTRKQILLHAAHQMREGKVLHWWHPITEVGLDANMTDDLLWLPFLTVQYLKETADWSILDEKVRFYDHDEPHSLLRHCERAIECVLSRMSPRGLPLILAGDWNDGLSAVGLEGKGESIWLAHFLYYVLTEFSIVAQRTGGGKAFAYYDEAARHLKKKINEHGWDGDWFWRASKDTGERIGSHACAQGKIFLNPQSWAVIADSTTAERKRRAMDAVAELLETDVIGPLLLRPAYSEPDAQIGYLSRYAPGLRENGGVYMHAATWAIWAECLLQRPERAYEIYRKICPVHNGMHPDRYFAEPYVTPGNIDGPDSPHCGRGGWSWYTGSAAWLYRVTIDAILGVRADYDGLRIAPQLPAAWNSAKVKRFFRGVTYHIQITRSDQECTAPKIVVDGAPVKGLLITPVVGKTEVEVDVKI